MRARAFFLALLLALSTPAAAAPAAAVLEKVIILQRHGVRAPTKSPDALAPFARQSWPEWPVAPGELTDHGAAALARMGDGLRHRYAGLVQGDCGRVFVWADNADQRTRLSGNAMAAALTPGCRRLAQWASGGDDPLFHGDRACPADPEAAQQAVAARLPDIIAAHRKAYDTARQKLTEILDKVHADDNAVRKGGRLDGLLGDASSLTENLYLEYAQGMERPGWGRLSRADLDVIMPLHNIASDLTRRTPLLAGHNGALLAQEIVALLRGAPGRVVVPDAARVIVLAGHDTNLSNIAALLGVTWRLPGQPDITAPDTALAFEVWRGRTDQFIRLRLFYQTVDQLRDLSVLPDPLRRDLTLPDCRRDCAIAKVTARLQAGIARECLAQ